MSVPRPGAGEAWQDSAEVLLSAFESLLQEVEVEAAGQPSPRSKWSSEELLASCQALLDDAREAVSARHTPLSTGPDRCPATLATPASPLHEPAVKQVTLAAASPACPAPRASPAISRAGVGNLSTAPASPAPAPAPMAAAPPGCTLPPSLDCVSCCESCCAAPPGAADRHAVRGSVGAPEEGGAVSTTAFPHHLPVAFPVASQPPPLPDTVLAAGESGSAVVEGPCGGRAACVQAEGRKAGSGLLPGVEAAATGCPGEWRHPGGGVLCGGGRGAHPDSEEEGSVVSFRTCSSGEVESLGWCSASEGEADSDAESECSLGGFTPSPEDVWQWNPSYEESRRGSHEAAVPPDEDSEAGAAVRGRCQQVVEAPPPHPVLDIQALGRLADTLTCPAITRKDRPSPPSSGVRRGAEGGEAGPGEDGEDGWASSSAGRPVPDEPCRRPVPRGSTKRLPPRPRCPSEETHSADIIGGGGGVQEQQQAVGCVASVTSSAEAAEAGPELPRLPTPSHTPPQTPQPALSPSPERRQTVVQSTAGHHLQQQQPDISVIAASRTPPCEARSSGGVSGEARRGPARPEASPIWWSYQQQAQHPPAPVTYSCPTTAAALPAPSPPPVHFLPSSSSSPSVSPPPSDTSLPSPPSTPPPSSPHLTTPPLTPPLPPPPTPPPSPPFPLPPISSSPLPSPPLTPPPPPPPATPPSPPSTPPPSPPSTPPPPPPPTLPNPPSSPSPPPPPPVAHSPPPEPSSPPPSPPPPHPSPLALSELCTDSPQHFLSSPPTSSSIPLSSPPFSPSPGAFPPPCLSSPPEQLPGLSPPSSPLRAESPLMIDEPTHSMATHPPSGPRKRCASPRASPRASPSSPAGGGEELSHLSPSPPPLQCESPCVEGVPELVIVLDGLDGEGGEGGPAWAVCPAGDAPRPLAREEPPGVGGPALPHRPTLTPESCRVSCTTEQHWRPAGGGDAPPDTEGQDCQGEGEGVGGGGGGRGVDTVTASPPGGCPAPPPRGKATLLCEVPRGDMQGPEWSDLGCWQCGEECQVPQRAGTSDGQTGSRCHGMVGEAHAARCPAEVVGSLQVLVGEALWQYPVLGPAEQGLHHAGEEWTLVLSGHGWRAAINSGGGGELVTMSSDNMAGGAAPSPATLRREPPSMPGRYSSIYGFKISGADSSNVRNLLPVFLSSRNPSRELPSGVTFRVKGDASWQTQRSNRNSDKCDIRMYRGVDDRDDSRFIKLCGVNLGSCPASPDPYPLARCSTLPRRLPSYRLSPLPSGPRGSMASPDPEILASDPVACRLSLLEPEDGAAAPVQPGGDAGGGRGCGTTLPRPPPPHESSSIAASHPWSPSAPLPPWGATGSAPPDATRCYVNSIPRPYRGSASSSSSSSPVPPAVPQLHRPRDFLPATAGHSESPQGEVASLLPEDDLDDCLGYERQPPAPLLTTRRAAAQRSAAGHPGTAGRVGEAASVRDPEVEVHLTSTNTHAAAADLTTVSGVNCAAVSDSDAGAAPETAAEDVAAVPSPGATTSWPVRGPSSQGCPRQESGPPVITLSAMSGYHAPRREPARAVAVVEAQAAVMQGSAPSPCSTPPTHDDHQQEASAPAGTTQRPCGTTRPPRPSSPAIPLSLASPVQEVTPPSSKEATPTPSPPPPAEVDGTPPTSKEATPQPSLPSGVDEEAASLPCNEATPHPPPPRLLEDEATLPPSKEATPSPIMEEEATPLTSREATLHPSTPPPDLDGEATPLVASPVASEEGTPQPSQPSPPPHAEEATPCHTPALHQVTLPSSLPCKVEDVKPPSQFNQGTPPPSPPSSPLPSEEAAPSPSSSSPFPIEGVTSHSFVPSPSLCEEATSPSPSEEVTLSSPSKEAAPPPSPHPITTMQVASPASSLTTSYKEVTPPPSPSCTVSKEATPSDSSPSITPTEASPPPPMMATEATPLITTKEATPPPPSPGMRMESGPPRRASSPVGSGGGEVGVRGAESPLRPGISQRTALLTRHQQADGPAHPRSTRFPLDIICGSKVSGEASPVVGTRHRLSSLGQVLPPPAHTSARSKSASRAGSGGTDPVQGILRRDSDAGPQDGGGRALGQTWAAAPLPVVLPLDTTLQNKIRQTIDSFASAPAPAPAPVSAGRLINHEDELVAKPDNEAETVEQVPDSAVPGDEAPAGEDALPLVVDSPSGVQDSDDSGATTDDDRQCLSAGKNVIENGEVAGQTDSTCSSDMREATTPGVVDTAEDHRVPRSEDVSAMLFDDTLDLSDPETKLMIVEPLTSASSNLSEGTPASTNSRLSSNGSCSPSRFQELERQLLFIDEGTAGSHEAVDVLHSSAATTGCHKTESLASPLQEQKEDLHTDVTSQSSAQLSPDEDAELDVSAEETFAAVQVIVTEARESSPECGDGGGGGLVQEESTEDHQAVLEVMTLDPNHSRSSSHSSVSVATVVTVDSLSHTPELPHPDDDAEEEFVDASDGTEGGRETPPINGLEVSPMEAGENVSSVGESPREECEAPEEGSISSGGQATDLDLPASASASASSTGSETWWTSAGGPVARRDLFPLNEDEDKAQWRTAPGAVHLDTDEEPAGYESDEDFAAMDADMQRLEEKLKKFERELGGQDGGSTAEGSECKGDSVTSPARSSLDNESLRLISIPEIFPSRRSTQTKHLSLMTRLEVHQYGDSATESENESRASSSSDSADFLFVKTKVKVKPGQRISRSLEHRQPKNHHVLGKSPGEGGTKKKEDTSLFEDRVDLSSLVLPIELAGEEPAAPHLPESVGGDRLDDDLSDVQAREETLGGEDVCEAIPEEVEDVLWGDEDHLLLGYIWHDDDMAAVDFEGLEDFQSFEGQEALMFMFEDDEDEDEAVSDEESESEVLPESRDEADLSPAEYLADESECEGDSRRSRTLPANTKAPDSTFVAAFKNGLRKASKYFGPKSENRPKKGGGKECPLNSPGSPAGLEDTTTAGVYNVQSGVVGGPTPRHVPFSDSDGTDIYSCSSGEYYAAPAMCVNTSDEDPSLALTRTFTAQTDAPSQPPVPPRRWSNRKARSPQETDVSPRGPGAAVRQGTVGTFPGPVPAPVLLPATSPAHTCVQRTDDHTNGSKDVSSSLAGPPQQMHSPLGSPVWEGYCPPAAPFPGPPHLLPQPCLPAVPWAVDPYSRVPEVAHPQHTIPNHRLAHAGPAHPCAAPDAALPYPCDPHLAHLSRPCAGHLAAPLASPLASPMAAPVTTHSHKPTSVKQLKRKQQEKILRQEAEEGLEAAGCVFCVGAPQPRPQHPQPAVHWRQSSPHPHASSDRRSWPPRK